MIDFSSEEGNLDAKVQKCDAASRFSLSLFRERERER